MDKQCLCDLTKEHEAGIIEICQKYADKPGSLITILNDVQEYFGFLPIQVQEIIARETGISLTEIYGVATFYSRFSLTPTGKHKVSVCLGTACYVKGAQSLVDGFERQLGVKVGETTEDGEYTLEATRCIGACGLAPVLTVDGEVYGNVTTDDISKIMKETENKEGDA
ncbi:MAG: NADH-quinone oxidoreductase subunit NuoE [Coprobacillaceae bacterium]